MSRDPDLYTLPTGEVTEDGNEYARAWRMLAKPVEELMGWRAFGFDPGVSFARPGNQRSERLPVDLLIELFPLLTGVGYEDALEEGTYA